MAGAGARDNRDARSRSRGRQEAQQSLKAFRYEDAVDGVPPISIKASTSTVSLSRSIASGPSRRRSPSATPSRTSTRPRTSPSPSPSLPTTTTTTTAPIPPFTRRAIPTPPPSHRQDIKRDSAIAPSISTATRTSYAESESQLSTSAAGAARVPSLPTIVVQGDPVQATAPASAAVQERSPSRSKSPFARIRRKDKLAKSRSASPPKIGKQNGVVEAQKKSEIGGLLDDIDLGDLASEKLAFSSRGSLYIRGRKLGRGEENTEAAVSIGGPSAPDAALETRAADIAEEPLKQENGAPPAQDKPVQRLVPGPRKPNTQTLEATTLRGRVLSAEETTFSMKVRSMYDHGDEKAATWSNGLLMSSLDERAMQATPSTSRDGAATPNTVYTVDTPDSKTHPALREAPKNTRASYLKRENEVAGGIEDWDDVNGGDVDRYGFINAPKNNDRTSLGSGPPGEGMQRVTTSLRLQAEQPRQNRRLRRRASHSARSSHSVPPRNSRDNATVAASVHSLQSTKSLGLSRSRFPFRSNYRRAVAEAADMLTLPPGLEDIREQEDAGRTASMMKRREWAREQKWQKMARPVPSAAAGKGGGMQFTFDTNDPKVISRTWKGIPDRWRAMAWYSFLAASAKKRHAAHSEEELVEIYHRLQALNSADDVQIDVDVPRTIGMHIMFRRRYRGGQRLLFRVLHAMSLQFEEVGYVQGMGSVAATLLCYFDEERAFVMMVRLWQLRGLEDLYRTGFDGLFAALRDFELHWLAGGDVARKLDELSISPIAYGTRWYLTLFNLSVPFAAQLRIWDVFMLLGDKEIGGGSSSSSSEGTEGKIQSGTDLDVLHATSAALIDATREIVLDSDFENAMKALTSFVPIRDEDLLMRVARAEWKLRRQRHTKEG